MKAVVIDLRGVDPPPTRNLTCTGCGDLIGVWDAPEGWIDPASFRCIRCMGGDPHERQDVAETNGNAQARGVGESDLGAT